MVFKNKEKGHIISVANCTLDLLLIAEAKNTFVKVQSVWQ